MRLGAGEEAHRGAADPLSQVGYLLRGHRWRRPPPLCHELLSQLQPPQPRPQPLAKHCYLILSTKGIEAA